MSKKECEKIIDMAVEQGNANGPVEKHARHCAECAAILACLGWLKTQGSPTSSLQPSAGFLSSLESKLGISGTAAPLFSGKTAIALLVAAALTVAAVTGILHITSSNNSDRNPATTTSTTGASGDQTQTDAAKEAMKTHIVAPVLQFPSPADDVE